VQIKHLGFFKANIMSAMLLVARNNGDLRFALREIPIPVPHIGLEKWTFAIFGRPRGTHISEHLEGDFSYKK
jgi:hypothetical protein